MRPYPRTAVLTLILLSAAGAFLAAADPLTTILEVQGELPPFVDSLGPAEELLAVAVSPDRTLAAGALRSPDRKGRSIVRLVSADEAKPTDLEMVGSVRSVVFGYESRELFVLLFREAKRREGDAYLVRIEVDTLKARKEMPLPASSWSLARAATGDALLVASRNEIRTVLIPGVRSGPLFRINGDNLAVSSVPGGTQVLVGQQERILLFDLSDPPGREQMPIRETVPTPGPVMAVAVHRDGSHGLARLADGQVLPIWLDPLRFDEVAPPRTVTLAEEEEPAEPPPSQPGPAALEPETPAPPAAPPMDEPRASVPESEEPPMPEPEAPVSEPEELHREQPQTPRPEAPPAEPAAAPITEAAPPTPATPAPETPAAEAVPAEAVPEPEPAPEPSAESPPAPARETAPPVEPQPTPSAAPAAPQPPAEQVPIASERKLPFPREPKETTPERPQTPAPPPEEPEPRPQPGPDEVRGRIGGPAAGEVRAVVLLGPNNLLLEAARVRPAADGSWSVTGLAPGKYRVQLDAGGQKALISDPPFRMAVVQAGEPTEIPEIRVLRAL